MKFITWDVGILAALCILLAYSILIRKHKALAVLVSVYISYVMTTLWGDQVVQFFTGQRVAFSLWIQASGSPFLIRSILFGVLVVLLSSFIKLGGKRSKYSIVEVVAYSVCAVALAALLITTLMPADYQRQILAHSLTLPVLYAWRQWVLGLPVFVMILFGIYGNEDA